MLAADRFIRDSLQQPFGRLTRQHAAVSSSSGRNPGAAQLNERMTNLLAAQTDLQKLMAVEEVGEGRGVFGTAAGGLARLAEAIGGASVPAAAGTTDVLRLIGPAGVVSLQSLMNPFGQNQH